MAALKRTVQAALAILLRDVGRTYVGLFGGVIVAIAFSLSANRNTVANITIVAGSVLVALGGLAPWFRQVRWKHGSLEIEDPQIQRARAGIARELAERQRTPGVVVSGTDAINAARYYTATAALEAVCKDAERLAPGFSRCQFRLFMYDELQDRLVAVLKFPGQDEPTRTWKMGEGVTGIAFQRGEYAIAVGEATHDDTFNLDSDAQVQYSHLTEVAAAPIFNASREVVGVLSASHAENESIIGTLNGRRAHTTAAVASARIVIDLLGWRSDATPDAS